MVWLRREDLEDREVHTLSPWAALSRDAGGRRMPEAEDGMRTAFQRDRDRIIHSTAFRRLQGKTQVVAAFEGDHFRSRLTHSLEVAQISRSVSVALRLNSDLAEAIALAHDLGHPPFGHVGEEALDELMAEHGGFRHNAQGARIVDYLEDRHATGFGMNLTRATRKSLLKGRIPDGFPLSADLLPRATMPIEAHIVDLCDKIAYLAHDVDDGLRAGLFTIEQAAELRLWQRARVLAGDDRRHHVVSKITSVLLHDLVTHCDRSLRNTRPGEAPPRIAHSDEFTVMSQELLQFLRDNFYRAEKVLAVMRDGAGRIRQRFARHVGDPDSLPPSHRNRIAADGLHRAVCDYIAGMTDRFLLRETD
jgi:dGTPase